MTITWRLRPNLAWHDGHPLTADDFAFAFDVYGNSALGQASNAPIPQIEDVSAPDSQTVSPVEEPLPARDLARRDLPGAPTPHPRGPLPIGRNGDVRQPAVLVD